MFRRTLAWAAVAAAIGIAYPYVELAWKCRPAVESSEACVWARAYFPLTRWAEPLLVAPIAFLAIAIVRRQRAGR